MIRDFRGKYSFLSNFYPCKLIMGGKTFASVEHYYQANKAARIEDFEMIRTASTALLAKRLGQAVQIIPDWDAIKIKVMRTALKEKFKDPKLRLLLLETKNETLVEENWWGDTFWGVDARLGGENMLGRLLMEIREEIR